MIKLTVNELPVEVEPGSTVLEAVQKAGFNVPTLCYHPKLVPYGACRLCLVEVEGARTLQPSCTFPAAEGMKVQTDTEKTKAARHFVLSMLFSERNHFCMYCQDTDGDCDLQQAAYDEGMNHWPITPPYKPYYVDTSHPDFVLDNNRCIICRRCVRTCAELVGNHTLGIEERGSANVLVADGNVPLGESTCISCGNCVQVCPTGALFDRRSMYQGRETDLTHTKSVCLDCSVGCYRVVKTRDNRLVRVDGDMDATFADGLLCEKGRYNPVREDRVRVNQPLIRRDGELQPINWEDALNVVSTQLKAHDSAEIKAYISGRQSIENLSAFQSFFKENYKVGQAALLGHDESAAVSFELAREFGAFESDLNALLEADAAIILGADMINDYPVAGFMLKRKLSDAFNLVMVTKEANALANHFTNRLVSVGENYEQIINLLSCYKDGGVCDETEKIIESEGLVAHRAYRLLQSVQLWQDPVIILGGEFAKLENLEALKKLVRYAQQIGAKVIIMKGDTNSFAASLLGLELNPEVGKSPVAFYALGDGHACHHALEGMKNGGYKIVQTSYMDEFAELADLVLPGKIWAEEEGHYLTTDGRIELNRQALEADGQQRSVSEVLADLSAKSGFSLQTDWQAAMTSKVASIVLA
jgi:formate dehydrogenase major subunit